MGVRGDDSETDSPVREDLRALRDLGLYAAILGKAYYTGAVKLPEALEAAR